MKKILVLLGIAAGLFWTACSRERGTYLDLRSGERIRVEKDASTGAWVNVETKEPVYIYVDTKKNDTIYGRTGKVINGHVMKASDNVYWYDVDYESEYKVKSGDYKRKVEDDGDMKIKDGDNKVKVDGKTGETKVKRDD
jgi:hypothetical protein